MLNQDWAAAGLNNVGHSFGTRMGDSASNPFLQKAFKDQKRIGSCFSYSMLWCRQCIKLNRKLASKAELLTSVSLMVAAQAMQSWQVRQNKKGAFGAEGMFGEGYYKAMAQAFSVSAAEAGKDADFNPRSRHAGWLEIATATDGFYVIAFTFLAGGAHAVAVMNKGRDLVFFDPLTGQYSLDNVAPWDTLEFQIEVEKSCNAHGHMGKWIAVRVTG